MSSYPSGTVTFLFTDIEGSTRLWQDKPEAMAIAHARHDEILRTAIETNHGYVFQIVGDSFSAAFHNAPDGLRAVLAAQRGLHQQTSKVSETSEVSIRARMGLHTGTAEILPDGKYEGYTTIATTQRVMSAAHGGQTLLTQTTYDLLQNALPGDVTLRDLGEHRLKDLRAPLRLYQVNVPDLPQNFPSITSPDIQPNNLPTQLTSFVGRKKEIAEIKALLNSSRLVTLTGSGGAGKTRLSLQVGAECLNQFSDGVWFAELAPLADPALVPQTLLAIFDLHEDSHRPALQVLMDYLRPKTLLLLLDNCEHLIAACAEISETLLRACPKLKILASSREALGIAGEVSWRVPSLAAPNPEHLPTLEKLLDLEAVQLFIARATTAKPEFTVTKENAPFVAQICFRLDGIPLALELAAARLRVLSPEQIAIRLDDRFRLLTGGSRTALPRQQTLRAMIDWSYSLLSEPEKALFRRLAVFVSGWTLEAAEAVCANVGQEDILTYDVLDLLTRLVDKSLVLLQEGKGEIRYHRLETIRQYSREKFLETDEVETIRNRHLAFYVGFTEEAERRIQQRERVKWAQALEAEQDNLRAAMEWGLVKNPTSALRIASSLVIFWTTGGYSAEGFRWIQQSLEQVERLEGVDEPSLRAKGLRGLAYLYMSLGNNQDSKHAAQEAVTLYRQSGDRSGLAFSLYTFAFPLEFLGEHVEAEAAVKEAIAIARAEKDIFVVASGLSNLARVTLELYGDIAAADGYIDQAIRISQEAGIEYVTAVALEMKARIAARQKNYAQALKLFEQALSGFQKTYAGFNVLLVKSAVAHLERERGELERALELYRETIIAFRDVGQTGAVAHQLECFGFIAMAWNQTERAVQLFAAADALREKSDTPMTPDEQVYLEEQLKTLHEQMDSSRFDAIWSAGRAMTMEQAIQFALDA